MNNSPSAFAEPSVMDIDGSCLGNPGPMGWAYHIQWPDGSTTEKALGAPDGTNNQAELRSCIDGLKASLTGSLITIITDSNYVRLGATVWSIEWIKKNWKNGKGKPVANKDLWIELLALIKAREVTFERVAGHSGDPMNDHVDALAKAAAEQAKNAKDT
jgi:ribonuclease HI